MFSGSYAKHDVTFLLKPVRLEPTPVAEKERLIQSGRRHYSEMISRESLPSAAYLRIFHETLAREKGRFARDLLHLARHIASVRDETVTLVSLARAGIPAGVLVGRVLRNLLGRRADHYSVSIIRDRGIDEIALRFILDRHTAGSVVFVDGWTGKGVIAEELGQAVGSFNARHGVNLDAGLYTVADLCGAAAFAATCEDYVIPSSVLGATICGLVSRSILNDSVIGPGDFHGCLYYEEFAAHDLSRWFVDEVYGEIARQAEGGELISGTTVHGGLTPRRSPLSRSPLKETSVAFVEDMRRRFGVRDVRHIKPGLGEATRVLLRRVPDCLLVRDARLPEVAHLLVLAREKNVPTIVDAALPYAAAALIKELDG
jgi:hypothetical protein